MDRISLDPPTGFTDSPLCIDEINVVLPTGYTLESDAYGCPTIFDEKGNHCNLCLNSFKGTVILAVSLTRAVALKRAPEGEEPLPLQEARIAANLTQRQLADAAGVNIRLVQKLEGGEADAGNVTAKNLLALADALGVDPRSLL